MDEGKATQERPNLPKRLEHIEELLESLHATVSRMRPPDDPVKEIPTAGPGLEMTATRIEESVQRLIHRLSSIADTVGQL